ncbi:MAG: SRPBCC domain-containing protein [Planctomycetes bacterium]|nr:SRPBCC domain-containing protein [Planctomycetota bacterium]
MATRRAAAKAKAVVEGSAPKTDPTLVPPGLRQDGFELTVQRAIAVPADDVWQAFASATRMSVWGGARHRHQFREGGRWSHTGWGGGRIRRVIEGRYIGMTWAGKRLAPGSIVEVSFRERGAGITVKLSHCRIKTAEEREELRALWSWAMDSLKSYAETGVPIAREDWVVSR